jgi:hypothetical protein
MRASWSDLEQAGKLSMESYGTHVDLPAMSLAIHKFWSSSGDLTRNTAA